VGALARTHHQDKNPPDDSVRIARGLGGSCRVHKPGVPRGPASAPGLGPGKQHVVHRLAQESKTQRARRTVRSPTGRSTQRNKHPLVKLLWPTSPTEALASDTSHLRAVSPIGRPGPKCCFLLQPRVSDWGPCRKPAYRSSPTSAARADWGRPTGDARLEGTRGERRRQRTKSKPRYRDHTLYACGSSASQQP